MSWFPLALTPKFKCVLQGGGGLWHGRTNTSDAEALFYLGLHFTISSGAVSARVCDGRDDFNFEIVNFPFLDDDVPHSVSGAVCVSQNVQFAGASDCVVDFCLLIFLNKGIRTINFAKPFF